VQADLEALRRHTPPVVDRGALRAIIHEELADWQAMLTGLVTAGREVLRALLHGPLRCSPDVKGHGTAALRFEGAIALDRVLRGRSCLLASPTGTAHLVNSESLAVSGSSARPS